MDQSKKPLSPKPRRTDFTDREFCNIIGGLLGGLTHAGEIDDLRNAVRWWAETDQAWEGLRIAKNRRFDDGGFPLA